MDVQETSRGRRLLFLPTASFDYGKVSGDKFSGGTMGDLNAVKKVLIHIFLRICPTAIWTQASLSL